MLLNNFTKLMDIRHISENKFSVPYALISVISSIEYISKNLSNKLDLKILAKKANMSRSTYLKYFQEVCNCSPSHFINNSRLNYAAALLTETILPIIDIALECGYFDSSHFIRFFTRKHNLSPNEYRKIHQKKSD